MAQITEDYVSFETAKLLKEKGFNEECFALYNPDGMLIQSGIRLNNIQVGIVKGSYSAPTLQMAMKWLRKIHSLEIYPYHNSPNNRHNSGWWFEIIKYPNSVAEYESGIDEEFDTHEEACEAAIKYCLENLI